MRQLNLPSFDCKIKESEGKTWIFDPIRKKYLVLTPEEWVRQHLVNLLIQHLGYPASLIKLEGGLSYEKLDKRSDILVFDRDAKPFLLVECKAPEVPVSKKTVEQASRYNKILKAPYLAVSNGLKTFCFSVDFIKNETVQMTGFPEFSFP